MRCFPGVPRCEKCWIQVSPVPACGINEDLFAGVRNAVFPDFQVSSARIPECSCVYTVVIDDDDRFQTPDKRHTSKKIGKKNPSLPPTTSQTSNTAQAPHPPAESSDSQIEDEDAGKSNSKAVGTPLKSNSTNFCQPS
ncbi:hypothetical protein TNCV_270511 [Trichonephila clavipes]|nr:hypothetical protein TNCV_270511 [Trichonephila clavipes]